MECSLNRGCFREFTIRGSTVVEYYKGSIVEYTGAAVMGHVAMVRHVWW